MLPLAIVKSWQSVRNIYDRDTHTHTNTQTHRKTTNRNTFTVASGRRPKVW